MKSRSPSGFSSSGAAFLVCKCVHAFCLFVASDFLHSNGLSLLSFTFALMIGSALLFLTIQRAWGVILRVNMRQVGRMVTNGALLAGSLLGYAFGLKHCGPIRTILMEFCNHLLLLLPALMWGWADQSTSRRKGLCFVVVAVVLMMMSRETSVHHQSVSQSINQSILDATTGRFHVASVAAPDVLPDVDEYGMPVKLSAQVPVSMRVTPAINPSTNQSIDDHHTFSFMFFTISEGTAGMLALILSSTLAFFCKNYEKRHAKEFGGRKRFHAVSMLMGGLLIIPFIVVQAFFPSVIASPDSHSISVAWIFFTLCILVLFMVVLQFYVDQIAQRSDLQLLTKLNLILSFVCAVAIDAWRGEDRLSFFTIAAAGSILGGVHYLLHSPQSESTPLPLSSVPQQLTPSVSMNSAGLSRELRLMLKHITSDRTSLRIFSFLCLNMSFMFVELSYGYWSNSLGLISDAGHMLFDCTALGIGLYASYVSRMKSNSVYTYGYGRYEILSGYVNAVFLLFIAYFIFVESVERLFTPVVIQGENLVFVSAFGLCVNLVGLFFFHDHAHGGGGHGHSHGGGHGHSHGGESSCGGHDEAAPHTNHNMMGIYLHILADTLGSCGVIFSSLLIKFYNITIADSICSIIISVLIVGSTGPLLRSTLHILLNRVPEAKEEAFLSCISTLQSLQGVREVRSPHLWLFSDAELVCTLHLLLEASADEQQVMAKAADILKGKRLGVNHLTLQCEKDKFHANTTQMIGST